MGRQTRSKSVLADKTNVRRESTDKVPKKVCVYQLKETATSSNEDVYEFEFDSQEEPRGKFKKNRAKTKKTAVKRLKAPAKPGSKSKKTQKKVTRKSVSPPKPAAKCAPLRPVAALHPSILPKIPSSFQAHVPAALRKDPQIISKACIIASPSLAVQLTPTSQNTSVNSVPPSPQTPYERPESPALENLFDDDDDHFVIPQQGPTRFEYQELAEARARVIRTSLTPRNAIVDSVPPMGDQTPEPAKKKQTSILNFIKGPTEPLQEEGLFSCSTPLPATCGMFSPARVDEEEPLCLTDVEVDEMEHQEEFNEQEKENEEEPRCAPMRLSLNTLKQVMESNKQKLAEEKPPSPKKYFSRVIINKLT